MHNAVYVQRALRRMLARLHGRTCRIMQLVILVVGAIRIRFPVCRVLFLAAGTQHMWRKHLIMIASSVRLTLGFSPALNPKP